MEQTSGQENQKKQGDLESGTFYEEKRFTPTMEAGLKFLNKEFDTDLLPADFLMLCRCSYMINMLQEKIYIPGDTYNINNIFMFTRLCGVIEDTYHKDRIDLVAKVVKNRILDFGGGLGDLSNALTEKGMDIEYYDINKFCKKFVKENYPRVKVADVLIGPYDNILCFDTLPYIEDVEAFGKLITTLIKPDGYFIMEDILETDPSIEKVKILAKFVKINVINTKKKDAE